MAEVPNSKKKKKKEKKEDELISTGLIPPSVELPEQEIPDNPEAIPDQPIKKEPRKDQGTSKQQNQSSETITKEPINTGPEKINPEIDRDADPIEPNQGNKAVAEQKDRETGKNIPVPINPEVQEAQEKIKEQTGTPGKIQETEKRFKIKPNKKQLKDRKQEAKFKEQTLERQRRKNKLTQPQNQIQERVLNLAKQQAKADRKRRELRQEISENPLAGNLAVDLVQARNEETQRQLRKEDPLGLAATLTPSRDDKIQQVKQVAQRNEEITFDEVQSLANQAENAGLTEDQFKTLSAEAESRGISNQVSDLLQPKENPATKFLGRGLGFFASGGGAVSEKTEDKFSKVITDTIGDAAAAPLQLERRTGQLGQLNKGALTVDEAVQGTEKSIGNTIEFAKEKPGKFAGSLASGALLFGGAGLTSKSVLTSTPGKIGSGRSNLIDVANPRTGIGRRPRPGEPTPESLISKSERFIKGDLGERKMTTEELQNLDVVSGENLPDNPQGIPTKEITRTEALTDILTTKRKGQTTLQLERPTTRTEQIDTTGRKIESTDVTTPEDRRTDVDTNTQRRNRGEVGDRPRNPDQEFNKPDTDTGKPVPLFGQEQNQNQGQEPGLGFGQAQNQDQGIKELQEFNTEQIQDQEQEFNQLFGTNEINREDPFNRQKEIFQRSDINQRRRNRDFNTAQQTNPRLTDFTRESQQENPNFQFTPTLGGTLFGGTQEVTEKEFKQLQQQTFQGISQRNPLEIQDNEENLF